MAEQLGKTLSQLEIRVRRWIREETAAKSRFSTEFLQQIINTHDQLRAADLHQAYEGFFTFQGTRDLIADQTRYAWPSGFTKLLRMELVRSDGRRVPIQRHERHFGIFFPEGATGQDEYSPEYRPVGNGFLLEPPPQNTVVNGLFLEWNGVPTELSAAGDAIADDFPGMFVELVVLDSAVAAFDAEGVQETGQLTTLLRLRQQWEEKWDRYIDTRLISRSKIVPFPGHYGDA